MQAREGGREERSWGAGHPVHAPCTSVPHAVRLGQPTRSTVLGRAGADADKGGRDGLGVYGQTVRKGGHRLVQGGKRSGCSSRLGRPAGGEREGWLHLASMLRFRTGKGQANGRRASGRESGHAGGQAGGRAGTQAGKRPRRQGGREAGCSPSPAPCTATSTSADLAATTPCATSLPKVVALQQWLRQATAQG